MDCSVHFILPTLRIQNNEDQNLNQNQNFVFCMTTSEPKKVLSLQKEFSQWWTHHSRLWLTSPDAWVARGNPTSPRRVVREMPRCPSTWIETPFFAEIRKSLWNTQEHTASITYLYMCTYVYIYIYTSSYHMILSAYSNQIIIILSNVFNCIHISTICLSHWIIGLGWKAGIPHSRQKNETWVALDFRPSKMLHKAPWKQNDGWWHQCQLRDWFEQNDLVRWK